MPLEEPSNKRTFAFFDGQNLFYAAKEALGYSWPNYDPLALARRICKLNKSWDLCETFSLRESPALAMILFGIIFGPLN